MEASQISANTPKELAALIEGRSDDEINQTVQALGPDAVLEKVFEGMVKAFLPERAGGQSAVIQWNVSTLGNVQTYQLKVADGRCTAQKGTPEAPRVSLSVDLPNFLRVITGKLNGQQAFFTGKLKLTGDMMFAVTQETWFDKNWGA
jgi:putative sterol carrier protein